MMLSRVKIESDPFTIKESAVKRLMLIFWRVSRADLRMLWFALSHPQRPIWLRPAAALLVLYALAPFNFVIPVLGIVDDLVLVPMLLHFLMSLVPHHVEDRPARAACASS